MSVDLLDRVIANLTPDPLEGLRGFEGEPNDPWRKRQSAPARLAVVETEIFDDLEVVEGVAFALMNADDATDLHALAERLADMVRDIEKHRATVQDVREILDAVIA